MLVVLASLAVAVPAGAADDYTAATGGFFSLGASAAPIGVEYFDAGAPVIPGEIVYGTVAFTRAAVDSVGNSSGFAAGPYFGDNVPALMGAANALGPQGAILPQYPFMVASQCPGEPKNSQEEGPRRLVATCSENDAAGDAHVGLARGNPGLASVSSTSKVKNDPATGLLSATAEGIVQGFSLGETLTIGQLVSRVEMTGRPGEKATKKTTLSVGPLTVMGQLVGLSDKGLVPVPGTPKATDVNSLTKQLAATGITVGLLPGEETETGIDSAAVVVGFAQKGPGGITRVRIILGRVRAKLET
jgi:hypothetical protein